MANMIVVDNGKLDFLKSLLALIGGSDIDLCGVHLFTNNIVPAHGDVIGLYTEAAWAGYASGVITGESAAALNGTNQAFSTAASVTFLNTTAVNQNAQGVYITNNANTKLYAAGVFTGAPLSVPAGGSLIVPLTILMDSLF